MLYRTPAQLVLDRADAAGLAARDVLVVMRHYPRFLRKEWVTRYVRDLAPPAALFQEFKSLERKIKNHNSAFYQVHYETRFGLTPAGHEELRQWSAVARERDVELVCQCRDFDRCHTDLLLLAAARLYAAPVRGPIFDYPDFRRRLEAGDPIAAP